MRLRYQSVCDTSNECIRKPLRFEKAHGSQDAGNRNAKAICKSFEGRIVLKRGKQPRDLWLPADRARRIGGNQRGGAANTSQSPGEWNGKIHIIPASHRMAMIFCLSGGHAHDALEGRAAGFGGTMESARDVATKYEVP